MQEKIPKEHGRTWFIDLDGTIFEHNLFLKNPGKVEDPLPQAKEFLSCIPKQFFTKEFIENVNGALTDDGIFAINYIKSSNGYENFDNYVNLLSQFFKVYKLHTGFFTSNTVIICSKRYNNSQLLGRIKPSFPLDKNNSFILDGYERMEEL